MWSILFVCYEPHIPHAVHRITRRSRTATGPRTLLLCTRGRLRCPQAIGRSMSIRYYSWEYGAVRNFAIYKGNGLLFVIHFPVAQCKLWGVMHLHAWCSSQRSMRRCRRLACVCGWAYVLSRCCRYNSRSCCRLSGPSFAIASCTTGI